MNSPEQMTSPFHEAAVRDVAEATGRDNSVFHFAMTVNDGEVAEKYKTERYAVSQRERVLELEAELTRYRSEPVRNMEGAKNASLDRQATLLEVATLCRDKAHANRNYRARAAFLEIGEKCLELKAASAPEKAQP